MADATRDILFNVRVGDQQAKKSWKEMESTMLKTERAGQKLSKTVVTQSGAMRRAGQVGMGFNRVIQDGAFFAQSANMGFLAVSNNLPILAEQFAYAKREGVGFRTILKGMFTGMQGWLTVINLTISGILAYTLASRGAKDETDELSGSVKTLSGAFNSLVNIENPFKDIKFDLNIEQLESLADLTSVSYTHLTLPTN